MSQRVYIDIILNIHHKESVGMDEEHRKFKRISFRTPVQYSIVGGQMIYSFEGKKRGGCLGCDLGAGGIRLSLDNFVPLKAEMSLIFPVGKGHVKNLEGRVVWVQKVPHSENYQVGLEFQDTRSNAHARAEIQQHIRKMNH